MSEIASLVWYLKRKDRIIISPHIDGVFYALENINWDEIELLGEL